MSLGTRGPLGIRSSGGGVSLPAWDALPAGTEGAVTVVTVEGALRIAKYTNSAGWQLIPPEASDYLYTSQNPMPEGSYIPMGNRSLLVPGGLAGMGSRNTPTAYTNRYRPAGPANQQYSRIRIGWRVQSNQSCTLDAMFVSSGGAAVNAITEDTATGWKTIVPIGSPVAIGPGGDPAYGTIQWLGELDVTPNGLGDIYISAQATGTSIPTIGLGSSTGGKDSIGWVRTGKELLTNLLTSGTFAPLTGGESFGTTFPLVIEFIGLTAPVAVLPFFGDSHAWGYGDDNQPSRPAGITARLDDAWRTAGKKVAVVNMARPGLTTAQMNDVLSLYLPLFPYFKIIAVQEGSINNYANGLLDAQLQTDWLASEAIVYGAGARIIGFSAFFINALSATKWSTHKAHWDWCQARLGVRSIQATRVNVVQEADGIYVAGTAYSDNSHGNTTAYDLWSTNGQAGFLAALTDCGATP